MNFVAYVRILPIKIDFHTIDRHLFDPLRFRKNVWYPCLPNHLRTLHTWQLQTRITPEAFTSPILWVSILFTSKVSFGFISTLKYSLSSLLWTFYLLTEYWQADWICTFFVLIKMSGLRTEYRKEYYFHNRSKILLKMGWLYIRAQRPPDKITSSFIVRARKVRQN